MNDDTSELQAVTIELEVSAGTIPGVKQVTAFEHGFILIFNDDSEYHVTVVRAR